MKKIIVFTGNIGSGKTANTNNLMNEFSNNGLIILKAALASLLKQYIAKYLDITKYGRIGDKFLSKGGLFKKALHSMADYIMDRCNVLKIKPYVDRDKLYVVVSDMALDLYNMYLNNDGRKILQTVGTSLVRNNINSNYWAYELIDLLKHVEQTGKVDYVFIDDVRFSNELSNLDYFFKDKLKVFKLVVSPEIAARRVNVDLKKYIKDVEFEHEIPLLTHSSMDIIETDNLSLEELKEILLKKIFS